MTKWINVPSDSWLDAELINQELVAIHHIVDHVLEVWASLVVHAPTSIDELETTFLDKLFHISFSFVSLFVIPHGEEFHFNVSEFTMWVLNEFRNNGAQDHVDLSNLVTLICSCVILVNSFEPSDIIVRVSNQMNVKLFMLILSYTVVSISYLFFELADIFWTSPVRIGSHCLK